MREWHEGPTGKVQDGYLEKVVHCVGDQSLEQTPQGSDHGTNLSESKEDLDSALDHGLVLDNCVRSRKLDLVIHMGPFQTEIFCGHFM